jgi:hypothetical protein
VTRRRRRWWIFRPLSRNPLSRPVDRVEGWAVVFVLVTLIAAAFVAVDVSETVEISETAVIQREHATRHPVQAVAVGPAEKQQQGTATVFRAHIRWFDGTETHDRTIRVPGAVAAGDRVDIWIDGNGDLKPEPRATSAAAATGFGTGALLWFAVAALAGGLLAIVRRLVDRRRFQAWDQALAEFAGRGGGWNAHNP